jgi:LruC domain-containing protein
LEIDSDFNFKTTEMVTINAAFSDTFSNIPIKIFGSEYAELPDSQDLEDFTVGSGTTDSEGNLTIQVTVPLSCSYIVLKPGYIGLPEDIRVQITNGTATYDIDDLSAYSESAKIFSKASDEEYSFSSELPTRTLGTPATWLDNYWYFLDDTYSNTGVPASSFSINLDSDFLSDLNNSILKYNKETYNAEVLAGADVGTLDIDENAKVWMTFIHERAGFYNTLGYYTYTTSEGTPSSIGVSDITLVFPNASYSHGYNKCLESGDSIYIGEFPQDTSLGFVIIANGWEEGSSKGAYGKVRKVGQGIFYSEYALNPEEELDQQKHFSIIYHEDEQVFLVGVEDSEHSDNDKNFNDVVFAVKVDDVSSVGNTIGSHVSDVKDTDIDGVIDSLDAFPDDATRTTVETVSGTLSYEDLWPSIGDYDFNDLVVGYSYTLDGNADNQIVGITMKYTLLASGAGTPDGLAIAIPDEAGEYSTSSWERSDSSGYLAPTASYTNDGNRNILIFARQEHIMGYGIKQFINTESDKTYYDPQSISFYLNFSTPVDRDTLGEVPYDVFILISTVDYGVTREAHLPQYAPTVSADMTLMNTSEDTYNADTQRYYKSANNLPWAIHVPGDWDYPLEKKSIVDGYKYFGTWAESGGEDYSDWYMSKSDYINSENIY